MAGGLDGFSRLATSGPKFHTATNQNESPSMRFSFMTPALPTPEVKGHLNPDAIDHKIIEINGEKYWVNMMPPGPEEHDTRCWPMPNPTLMQNYPSYIYNGPAIPNDEDEETPAERTERLNHRNVRTK
jgi:hypothetical protein